MDYAIIKTNGKQYKVSAGDSLTLDRLELNDKKTIVFDQVLLTVNGESVSIGKPTVNGAKVEASFVEDKKGEKIHIRRFKAKSRYRRTTGFRAQQTVVKIDKIDFGSQKADKSTKTEEKAKEEV